MNIKKLQELLNNEHILQLNNINKFLEDKKIFNVNENLDNINYKIDVKLDNILKKLLLIGTICGLTGNLIINILTNDIDILILDLSLKIKYYTNDNFIKQDISIKISINEIEQIYELKRYIYN